MGDLPLIIFKLNEKKRRGIFAFFVLTLAATLGFGTWSNYLFTMQYRGVFLVSLFTIFSFAFWLFSIWAIYRMWKDGDDGILISDEGVTDLSTGYNVGVVLWKDVERVKVMNDLESDRQYLVLQVRDPNRYILSEPTAIKRRSLMLKLYYYGSPICLSVRALNCTFEQLETAVTSRYEAYKERHTFSES